MTYEKTNFLKKLPVEHEIALDTIGNKIYRLIQFSIIKGEIFISYNDNFIKSCFKRDEYSINPLDQIASNIKNILLDNGFILNENTNFDNIFIVAATLDYNFDISPSFQRDEFIFILNEDLFESDEVLSFGTDFIKAIFSTSV